jgi:uncharacterized protein (TIGR01777 family)
MKVAITGSSGLIGSALARRLAVDHTVIAVVRGPAGEGQVSWDPTGERLERAGLEGVDAVVHLAGAGIADKRWTSARKQTLVDSRVRGTGLLARTLAALDPRPQVLLSASAVGYYGDRGAEELTEASPAGAGFLADLCRRWEQATAPAEEAGIRVVHLRTGIVLSGAGGALAKQLPLFRLGVGGRLGSGRQFTSWIALDDEIDAIRFALETSTLRGAANLVAPRPVTNGEFTATLGRVLHRPAVLPAPAVALRLVLGSELADEAILAGQRVLPRALLDAGYTFSEPELEGALRRALL